MSRQTSEQVAVTAEGTPVPDPPPAALVAVPVRRYGTWALGLVVAVVVAALVRAFAVAKIDYGVVVKYFTAKPILTGVLHTLELTVLSMVLALVLGVAVAVMRQSQNPVLTAVAAGYTWLFRGTPLLVQLLIWFNLSLIFKYVEIPGVYSAPMNTIMTPFVAALLGLGVNEGAYIAEIVRGGILSVDSGQREAAAALGMSQRLTMRRIVLPQAMRVIVPPLGNEFIALLKYSSLAYTISYTELLQSANKIYTANFQVIELLFTASLWYILLTTVFTIGQQQLERRLSRGHTTTPSRFGSLLRRNLIGRRR
ncbi:amino acid ABC transporter permease [Planosporangium thailandense]|uniref:Amino acid ABC transporter permease n=1 Tax=Planosporangium thailandense TaxID=765197 RepID=A0ABX0XZ97_9ACTN|nr:amino acid ABC transporter permease [Planosporangium thailandense]NJC71376.1 amino acid ABC transporter permease [Planosporangium thailandense]